MRKVDRKTLEYMEARVKKAQEIVAKIDDLKKKISNADVVEKVNFYGFKYNVQFEVKDQDFLEEIIAAFVGKAEEEVKFLEQKLEEL
jgi:ppGpp synthetase/RelA/SpoT-type nucleotidyltranferase